MSLRGRSATAENAMHPLARQIEAMQTQQAQARIEAAQSEAEISLESMTPEQRQAASLGVSPDDWKPIGFMNLRHYDTLLKTNSLAPGLAQKIEAFKHVSME